MEFINDLNLKKQARALGISVWQTPGFLFIIMGLAAACIMSAVFYLSKNYDDPAILVISESLVAAVVIVIGTSVARLIDQITRLNRMKSEFVSVASHQLRTPLSAIRWELELLLTKLKKGLNEKQLKNIESINILSLQMARLINDLLDVARIDQKRLYLKKVPIDLGKIAAEVVKDASILAKERGIEIIFASKKNLPKSMGDPERIKMAAENLVSNAIKYTSSGGKIEIKIVKRENKLVFSVKDNGVGIPEEQLGRVFDKFFRSDNAVKYQTEGTGLGLYIAKNVIEQTGGEIWFQSVENLGSIFSFSLPIKENVQKAKENKKAIASSSQK